MEEEKAYEEEVQDYPSLVNKTVVITGTTSGTGFWCAVTAVTKQAKLLILLNRNKERAEASTEKLRKFAKEGGERTEILNIICDLADFDSVKTAAEEIKKVATEGIHVLVNNAGVSGLPDSRGKQGFEIQMQINHLSHFLLVKLLLPSLLTAAKTSEEVRVSHMTSMARPNGSPFDQVDFERSEPGTKGGNGLKAGFKRYGKSKLANIVFTMALHKKLQEKGGDYAKIKAVVAEPGGAATDIMEKAQKLNKDSGFLTKMAYATVNGVFHMMEKVVKGQSAAEGSRCLNRVSFAEGIDSGDFYAPTGRMSGPPQKVISKGNEVLRGKEDPVMDEKNQKLLWEGSEKAIGETFF